MIVLLSLNRFDPFGFYELQFDWFNGFTGKDKTDIAASISRAGKLATHIRDEAKSLLEKQPCPCPKLHTELRNLIDIANKIIQGVNSKSEKLEIEQGKVSIDGYAMTTTWSVWGVDPVLRFNNKSLDWHLADQTELDRTVLHELSHLYGTEDDNTKGIFVNAYNIEAFSNSIEGQGIYLVMLQECKQAQNKGQGQSK